ncbi:MAG: hypothetical protein ACJ8KO_03655, partial [Sulfurifustaceae bacterium]
VDEMVLVSNDEICAAIKDVYDDRRCILEPAGALAVAGLKRYANAARGRGRHFVAIASGANLDFHRLHHVSERAASYEQREALHSAARERLSGGALTACLSTVSTSALGG